MDVKGASLPQLKYYIETYGCAANQADSSIMKNILENKGWSESDENEADVIIINTCGVKKPTEDKILYRINEIVKGKRPIVVAGCLTRIDRERIIGSGCNVAIDVRSVDRIAEAAAMSLNGARGELITSDLVADKPAMIGRTLSPTIGVIEVQEGCNYNCTFCATKFSRGANHSFPVAGIIRAASELARQGAVEIWLTGQDVAAYYYEGKRLPELLEQISSIQSDFKIRAGMMTPPFAKAITKGMLSLFPSRHVYQFFHVPVQSGSDCVLNDMKRGYRSSLFEGVVNSIREKLPSSTIETDVIVGYPTETEDDFNATLSLLERVNPASVNLSKFWPMPGTSASKLKPLDSRIVSRRSKEAYDLILKIMNKSNEKWLGWEGEVLITERGSRKGTWKGRNFSYKQVVVFSEMEMLGRSITAKIESVDSVNLYAKPYGTN
ncbi:MAG: tRNA (N(6)-L-threonylcarbamoyladenosine(37)-C(2))-methylthiotransferase [Nitrososphaerota archaeon]|jgi:MiaB-like tRNA modifying enzyme|nr:tRNA (N(6)-L-threonylcarbamoyladenosine(37)-C(2))-methylthiotransferase [Nitrososphaerota archaeon]MDG6932042.1 tRNA (N(6)-L-threonylcarbamoyladenosine(37)-C(2))-methylthiotransferase [Nitrososphaerota archaeon]MDG6935417.1 tRNA (N(6)-L-threonylcarbamoyladenosine(37)-C(2))-methylthiotransferase [Nitrososphaerota archaeon]MDG6944581.1 tRNA (N(6)-L-threonylcarbamoyladenosine(37)-C(2))-methylthiotransferase [Nitrososphaerota archaeon]